MLTMFREIEIERQRWSKKSSERASVVGAEILGRWRVRDLAGSLQDSRARNESHARDGMRNNSKTE